MRYISCKQMHIREGSYYHVYGEGVYEKLARIIYMEKMNFIEGLELLILDRL